MGTSITQLLPEDVYDALINANAPTALNPFATMADLAGTGVNIYNSDGTLAGSRVVTLGGNILRFDMSNVGPTGDTFVIGGSPPNFPRNTYPIQFQNNTVIGGSLGIGGSGGVGSPYFIINASVNIASGLANGEIIWRSGVGEPLRLQTNAVASDVIHCAANGRVGIGISLTPANSLLEVNGDVETLTNVRGFIVLDRSNGLRYRIYTNGGVVNTELA